MQGNIEEYWRRQLVAMIRKAGTSIRKEEISRQALSASINLQGAIDVQKALADAIKILRPAMPESLTSDDISRYFSDILAKITLSLPNLPFSRLENIFHSLNAYIGACNHIISDLTQERIYIANIPEVPIPNDLFSAVVNLPQCLDTANRVVGTFKGIIESSEKK